MNLDFEEKFKDVIEFVKNSKMESPNKPVIPHVLRVGEMLYEKGFDKEIVKAGLLHDTLEWSSVSEKEIKEKFGKKVLEIIKANSKDRSIEGTLKRSVDMLERCKKVGDDAIAVKISDVLDSCNYYTKLKKEKELNSYREFVGLLLMNLSDNLSNLFFKDLNKVIK